MRRRIFSFVLVLCLLCSMLPMTAYAAEEVTSGQCGDNLTWTLDSNGLLTISGTGEMALNDTPWKDNQNQIKIVTISEGVTSIANWAFSHCSALEKVNLPGGITRIGDYAFYNCENLASINIPHGVTQIGSSAFSICTKLTYITLPDSVVEIGMGAFSSSGLTRITIPSSVSVIEERAFYGCENLTSITANSEYFKSNNGVLFNGDMTTLLVCPTAKESTTQAPYVIPSGVKTIAKYAFDSCYKMQKIVIPDTVTSIADYGFSNCGIGSVEIPKNVSSIGEYPFYDCDVLYEITVAEGNASFTAKDGVLYTADMKTLLQYPGGKTGDFAIPDGVADIAEGAFSKSKIRSVRIPSSITSIPDDAFSGSRYFLKSVELPEGLTSIGSYAFAWCESLESITIPSSVTTIKQGAFNGCDDLSTITFEGSAPELEGYSKVIFDDVTATCYYPSGDPSWDYSAMYSAGGTLTWIPVGGSASGKCGDNLTWSLADGVLRISGTGDMYDYNQAGNAPWNPLSAQILSVVVDDGVTSIGEHAFYGCSNLNDVTLSDTVKRIDYNAFAVCASLTTITMSAGLNEIDLCAFSDCAALTSIIIPASVTHIGDYAFDYCEKLTSITFRGTAPTLETKAFNAITATCYYPENDPTWDNVINKDYGGSLTWVPVEGSDEPSDYDWTLTADMLYVAVGETVRLEALGNDGEPVKGEFCEWYLSDTSLAQLSGNGYWATLYAREPGTVKVTLATALGDKSVDIVIEENLGTPSNPAVALGDNNLIGAWSTVQATFTPPFGSDEYVFFVEGDNPDWSISFDHGAEAIFHRTYGAYGYRVQLQEGITYDVQIRNDSNKDLRLRMMTISPDAPDLSFPSDTDDHAYVGDNWSFPVLPIPPDGKLQGNIRWSETDNTVVRLTAEGDRVNLVFIGEGTVTVTAEDTVSGKTAKQTFTVYNEQGGNNPNTIEFYGNGGTFEVTTAQKTWPTNSYGYAVPAGEAMGDYVVSISNPVFWNSNRAFTKWMACTHEFIYNDEGEQIGEDNIQIPGSTLMTTAEALQYPARSDGKTVIMVAQWEGSEFDYYSDVGFEVFGGTLIIDPVGDEAPFETPAPGGRCREDGTTIGEQLWFTIPNAPTHKDRAFEGWLQYNEETGDLISETTLSFAQIQNLVVPHYNVRFIAKWSGIDMDIYRDYYHNGENDGGNEERGVSIMADGMGQEATFTVLKDGIVSERNRYDWQVDLTAGETLSSHGYSIEDIAFWDPDRTFLGWNACILVEGQGMCQIEGTETMNTAQMLNYPAMDSQRIYFVGQWAGDDSAYYSLVRLDTFGGAFEVCFDSISWLVTDAWENNRSREGGTIGGENERYYGNHMQIRNFSREGSDFQGWIEYTVVNGDYQMVSGKPIDTDTMLAKTVTENDMVFVARWSSVPWEDYENYTPGGGDGGDDSTEGNNNVSVTGGTYGRFVTYQNGLGLYGVSGRVLLQVPAGSSLYDEGYSFTEWELYPYYEGETHTRIGWYVGNAVDENGKIIRLPETGLLSDDEMLKYTIPADQNIVFEAQWDAEADGGDAPIDGYVASITADEEVFNGDRILALIKARHSEETQFAAGEVVVSYDSSMLTFNENASNLGNATVKDNDGILILEDYGEDKSFSNMAYVLAFDTKATGTVTLTLESAAFVNKENAVKSDLIEATLEPASAVVTISRSQYPVALDGIFTGPATATDGESYTFYAADMKHYVYDSVSAVMGGNSAAVTDNGDGSYTVASVNGPLTITGSRSERIFQVTFEGSGADKITDARPTATYGIEYVFDLPSEDGVTYTLQQILIDGQVYTDYIVTGNTITIDGMHIHGDMVITITKTVAEATVTVEGNGAGAAAGYVTEAELGQSYTLTIVPQVGYMYTVTATMNGEPAEVIDNGDNTYTIEKVTGDIVFTVTRSLVTDGVTVSQYLKINGANVWIIKFAAEVEDGKVPTYDGNPMFWSDEYDAYCYLEITEVLDEEEAKSKLDITDGTAPTLGESMDVNGSGKIDASDAQLVYNMYNAMYESFGGDVTVEKYLRADVNKDGEINVQDAAAIIAHVLA